MKFFTVHILLFALLHSGCLSNAENSLKTPSTVNLNAHLPNVNVLPSPENKFQSIIEKYFVSQEYVLTNQSESRSPTEWEKQQFNMKSVSGFSIKSKNQVPKWEDTYYRFSFINETYETEQEAKVRITKLYEEPPALPMSEPNKAFPLRKGFSLGKNVNIIATDDLGYMSKLERLASGLQIQLNQANQYKRQLTYSKNSAG